MLEHFGMENVKFEVRLAPVTSLATVVKNPINGHLIHSDIIKVTNKQLVS